MVSTFKLIFLSIRYHWDSHRSNPTNFYAAIIAMVLNNAIVLWGLWVMLFDGKPNSKTLTTSFLALNAMVTIGWGSICFFSGGIRSLAEYIDENSLDPMMATPRPTLLLVSMSQSQLPALGDLIQGLGNLVALLFLAPFDFVVRTFIFSFVSGLSFLGMFIFVGSLPFFLKRAQALAQLLLECTLSLSFYPSSQIFSGSTRALLFLTPAALTALLPMSAIESATIESAIISAVSSMIFFAAAILFFQFGLKRYQSGNSLALRS